VNLEKLNKAYYFLFSVGTKEIDVYTVALELWTSQWKSAPRFTWDTGAALRPRDGPTGRRRSGRSLFFLAPVVRFGSSQRDLRDSSRGVSEDPVSVAEC
jgi:hypothetical protein